MTTHPAPGLPRAAPGASINPLVFDLLDWLAISPRPYAEVMDVWRTSCPRLTIWEDAVDLGFVVRAYDRLAGPATVSLTPSGRQARQARLAANLRPIDLPSQIKHAVAPSGESCLGDHGDRDL